MSKCIYRLPHSCGSSKGLQVFAKDDGGVDGYCFSCKTYIADPYGEPRRAEDIPASANVKTPEEEAAEMAEISSYGVVDLPDRMLRASSLDYYGIKIGLSEQDGKTPSFHYYPYYKDGTLVSFKVRLIEGKRFWSVGNQRDVDLFGWQQAVSSGARRLIITEGELDAVALHRILEMHGNAKYQPPAVVSLPHGAAAAGRDLAKLASKIRKHFKEISFCFDCDDDAGAMATEDACKVFPEATVITLPSKDANQCILDGNTKAAYSSAVFNASKHKNSRLVWGEDIHEEARTPTPRGELTWPWHGIDQATRGIRLGETIYIGAGVKMGKSELLNALAAHFIQQDGVKVLLAKPEEQNKTTYKMLANKIVSKVFTDPDRAFDYDAYDKAGEVLRSNLAMLNIYQDMNWETLKQDIIAAAHSDVKAVMIDPITVLSNAAGSAAEANEALQRVAQEAAALALDLNIVIFIFCHLKAPVTGEPHERGGKVLSTQFAGSRSMMRSCHLMVGLEGNKDPECDPAERNIRKLVILEDRNFGNAAEFRLYWNPETTQFMEA